MKFFLSILTILSVLSTAQAGTNKKVTPNKALCNSFSYVGDALVCQNPQIEINGELHGIATDGLSAFGFCKGLGYETASIETGSFWRTWMSYEGGAKLDGEGRFIGYAGSNGNLRGYGGCETCHQDQYNFVLKITCDFF